MNYFIERFKYFTKKRGLTYTRLSCMTGINVSVFYSWTKGACKPTLSNFLLVCEALQVSPNEFLGIENGCNCIDIIEKY